jgi:hypothetical protein
LGLLPVKPEIPWLRNENVTEIGCDARHRDQEFDDEGIQLKVGVARGVQYLKKEGVRKYK